MKAFNSILILVVASISIIVDAEDTIKEPLDCMNGSRLFGASDGTDFSDWKQIDKLSKDHTLTKIKVCTDSADRNVLGLQVTYGGYSAEGDALEEVPLDSHGIVDEGVSRVVRCDERELGKGEYISKLDFGFTTEDLVTLAYQISGDGIPSEATFGEKGLDTLQTRPVTFSPNGIMFFGFNGRTSESNGQLRGLGIIGYDALCVE